MTNPTGGQTPPEHEAVQGSQEPAPGGTPHTWQQQAPPPGGVPPAWQAPAWSAPRPHPSGLSGELRGWGIASHLGALGVAVFSAAILGFFVPLVVWLIKRDDHPYIDHHAKEALNFQLTVLVVLVASVVLAIPAALFGVLTLGFGFIPIGVIMLAALVAWIVLPIIAAVKAANGEGYRYPFTIRFVR